MKKTMKKYSILLGAAFGLFALASCQKEADVNIPESDNAAKHIPFVLKADVPETRTTLDASSWEMAWENGDVIYAVTTDEEWGHAYVDKNNTYIETIAEFINGDGGFSTTHEISDREHTFNFLYSAGTQKSYHRGASTTFQLYSNQTMDASAPTANLRNYDALAGQVTATTPTTFVNVPMNHLFTLMKVTLKNKTGEVVNIKSFEMETPSLVLADVYAVSFGQTISVTAQDKKASNKVSVSIQNGSIAVNGELPVYFVIAPISNYSGNITFTAIDENDVVFTKTNAVSSVTFNAGEYNTANFSLKGEPTITLNPSELNVFASAGGEQTVSVMARFFSESPEITVSSDNPQFTASVSDNTVTITAARNNDAEVKTGTITVTASLGSVSKSATLNVSQSKAVQPASDGDILWQEDFTGYSSMPATATGTHVYGEGTVTYSLEDGASETKLYNDKLAGGLAPELLVSKNGGSFKIANIPTGSVSAMTLTFKSNYDYCEFVTSTGVTVRDDATFSDKVKTVYLTVAEGIESFDLEFVNSFTSNCRVDNFLLVAGAPKEKEAQTISFGENKSIEWVIGTDCTLNTPKQGLTVTGNKTSVTYQSLNMSVATVDNDGKVTPLKAGTTTIVATAAGTDDYLEATDQYTLTITDPNSGVKQYTLTIDASDFNTTSYVANNNEKTSNAVASDNSTYEVKWSSNQVMKNGTNMQWQKSNGYIYNSTDLGTIKSVTVTKSAGTFTTYYGSTEHPTSGTTVGDGYFTVKVGSATGTTSKVVVVFEK